MTPKPNGLDVSSILSTSGVIQQIVLMQFDVYLANTKLYSNSSEVCVVGA